MTKLTIYHNPRCSKSRKTLEILQEKAAAFDVIEYLKAPPSVNELKGMLDGLDRDVREIIRDNEAIYSELNLSNDALTEEQLLEAIHEHPILLQRPIVVRGESAVVGRPPENVLCLLD